MVHSLLPTGPVVVLPIFGDWFDQAIQGPNDEVIYRLGFGDDADLRRLAPAPQVPDGSGAEDSWFTHVTFGPNGEEIHHLSDD